MIDLQPVVTLEHHHVAPTDDTGASVGAAPAAARGVLERNFPDLGCGGQFGEQNSSIGRKPQP